MAQEIEIEFKNLLAEEEFNTLYQQLKFESVALIEQTNYYFETDDFRLREQGAALRIRRKKETWTLTLKQPHSEGLLETHDSLTEEEVNQWIIGRPTQAEHVGPQLEELGISYEDLNYMGSLTTRRKEQPYKNTTVVLDHSFYYGKDDYELELEADSRETGEKVFQELLDRYHIPRRKTDNKIKRFFQAKSD
ncbi:CYTH domain-containing protein [Halobacillus sp. Marseille-Q1614]|uniref:CYTH domain-containing protein n=1 Tax=Halobacillus sp. Marseille-Q1614 TaxID=2709134 RepID=UPI00156FF767|nr:CYTH domain-containing protein [Halobacillus sp. Marseille-Q1614]